MLGDTALLSAIARLMLVLAIVNATVALLVNPWRDDRPSDRFPGIVQDVAVLAIFMVIATVLLREQLLTTSAVGAVVVGFALQDTLGNLFAGLAIQIEKPFRVGQWIQVERARRAGPADYLARHQAVHEGRRVPGRPQQRRLERAGAELLGTDPLEQRARRRRRQLPDAAEPGQVGDHRGDWQRPSRHPRPRTESAGAELRRFRDQLHGIFLGERLRNGTRGARSGAHQHLVRVPPPQHRDSISDSGPVRTRTEQPLRTDQHVQDAAARLAAVDLFAPLTEQARHALAQSGDEHLFAAGETIVRQGAAGESMFVILSGRVRVTIEPSGQEVAVIPAGGFFGEMSMLTGDARTATVKATEDAVVLEISAADFRALADANPALLDHVSTVVATRRTGLEEARATAASIVAPEARQNFLARMRRFLTLQS